MKERCTFEDMARVRLDVEDLANRLTVKALLEADGHEVVDNEAAVIITDDTQRAVVSAQEAPTLLLTSAAEIPRLSRRCAGGCMGISLCRSSPAKPR